MNDLVSRKTVLKCIKASAQDIDWGQSEDGDAFKHYVGALYRTVAYEGCVPSAIVRCRDCDNFTDGGEENDWCSAWGGTTVPDAYCSYGERKNGT